MAKSRAWRRALPQIKRDRTDAGPLCRARVAVVQAAQVRLGDRPALLRRADGPRNRRVAIQRQVRARLVIVAKVFGQDAVNRTSEFGARTTPEHTWILDRTVTLGKLLAL